MPSSRSGASGPTRPNRSIALGVAARAFDAGERIDMQEIAAELQVSRTTLYRWLGDRDHLIAEVIAARWLATVEEVGSTAPPRAGEADHAVARLRDVAAACREIESVRTFTEREGSTALRVLTSADSAVRPAIERCVARILRETLPRVTERITPEVVEICAQLLIAMEWVPAALCEESRTERMSQLLRSVLSTMLPRIDRSHS